MRETKAFVDSNILLCLFDGDLNRKSFAASLSNQGYTISTQVVNENVNVCIRQLKLSKTEAFSHGMYLINNFNLVTIGAITIQNAFDISSKYGYNYWDSLILSSAIENGCGEVYSEDMQHGQEIEKHLKIINPFLSV